MRAVVQRVKEAVVYVDRARVGSIDQGLCVFLGIARDDAEGDADYLAEKIPQLRIFEDADGRFNRSLVDVAGQVLVVSQFTLFGDCRKGRRPSFTEAAEPARAETLYRHFITQLMSQKIPIATGQFQASMEVALVNDGPVTLLLDSRKQF